MFELSCPSEAHTQHTEVKHFVALFLQLKYYSQAVQPYEMSSPGNTLKKRGWKYYQNVSCLPPPLNRKVSIYFINNTDFSVRHQITPAMTGPVHRISKLILLALHPSTEEYFKAGNTHLNSHSTQQASMGTREKTYEVKVCKVSRKKQFQAGCLQG